PGMDPYLEALWGDVHQRLITYAADQVGAQLPDDLRARVEERVFVEIEAEQSRRIVPDVHVAQYPPVRAGHSQIAEGGSGVAAPCMRCRCENGSRPFRFPCGRPIAPCRSICKRCSTSAIATAATMTLTMRPRSIRRSRRKKRHGRKRCSKPLGSSDQAASGQ